MKNRSDIKVLVACEASGIVRNAFDRAGFDAWSCDLEQSPTPTNKHIVEDVRNVLDWGWDLMMVAHPPCTRLCLSGVRWLSGAPKNPPADCTELEKDTWAQMTEEQKLAIMWRLLDEGAALFSDLWNADIPHIAVENPVMHGHAKERIVNFEKQAQTIQPWQFATSEDSHDNQKKRTCLWLKDLPVLEPLNILDGSTARDDVHKAAPGPDRWRVRSQFFDGIANAMADQWSDHICRAA